MEDQDPITALLDIRDELARLKQEADVSNTIGGFPDEIFFEFDRESNEDLICSICLMVLKKTRECLNGHRFCSGCIMTWSNKGSPNCHLCPVCRIHGFYRRSRHVDRYISQLLVMCGESKCQWGGTLEGWLVHRLVHYSYTDDSVLPCITDANPNQHDITPRASTNDIAVFLPAIRNAESTNAMISSRDRSPRYPPSSNTPRLPNVFSSTGYVGDSTNNDFSTTNDNTEDDLNSVFSSMIYNNDVYNSDTDDLDNDSIQNETSHIADNFGTENGMEIWTNGDSHREHILSDFTDTVFRVLDNVQSAVFEQVENNNHQRQLSHNSSVESTSQTSPSLVNFLPSIDSFMSNQVEPDRFNENGIDSRPTSLLFTSETNAEPTTHRVPPPRNLTPINNSRHIRSRTGERPANSITSMRANMRHIRDNLTTISTLITDIDDGMSTAQNVAGNMNHHIRRMRRCMDESGMNDLVKRLENLVDHLADIVNDQT